MYERMREHIIAHNRNGEYTGVSALETHKHKSHRVRYFEYGIRVLDSVYGSPTKRMLSNVRIESMKDTERFNRKKGCSLHYHIKHLV